MHYVTYVKVYDSTPEYVVVGYTPGYSGAYVRTAVVVYGTGYYYQPWIGSLLVRPALHVRLWRQHRVHAVGRLARRLRIRMELGRHDGGGRMGLGRVPLVGRLRVGSPIIPGRTGRATARCGVRAAARRYGDPATGRARPATCISRWGSTTAVTRRTGGYNAWTGNSWAGQAGRAYNSRTGVAAAGQRGVVGNVYSGNYAAGSRGAAVNTRTGAACRRTHWHDRQRLHRQRGQGGQGVFVDPVATRRESVAFKAKKAARCVLETTCLQARTATSTNTTRAAAGIR